MARSGNRNRGMSRLGKIILLVVLLFVVLTIISIVGVIVTSNSSSTTVPATLNSITISWNSDEKKAINNATLVAFDDQILAFEANDSINEISVSLCGQNSKKTYSASTSVLGIADFLGISAISVDGLNFSFDANIFEVGEIVLIKAQFDSDKAVLDKAFQEDNSYGYFAFMVGESQKVPQTETPEPENSAAPSTSTSAPAESTTNAQASVYFNGFMVTSHESREAALTSPISIGEDALNCSIKCSVGNNTKRVRVWTESNQGTSHGDEYFMWSDNSWTANVDFSAWSGETILICVCVSDNSVPATNTYSYIAANIP